MGGKVFRLLCVIIFILPLLSGCWDSMDIEKRATILALAIDKSDNTEKSDVTHLESDDSTSGDEKEMIRLTAQIAVPGRVPLGPIAEGGGGETSNPVWVLTVDGSTLDGALLNLQQRLADQLFLGHLRIIIISEEIAKEGVDRFNDYLRRQPEIRRTAWLAISKGEASTYMKISPELERIPALYLTTMVENTVKLGKFPIDPIGLFWRVHSSKGQDSYLPYLQIKKGPNIDLEGLAYFKGDSMEGTIKPIQIGVFMGIIDSVEGGYGAFYKVPGSDDKVLIRAIKRKTKIKTAIKNGVPELKIRVRYQNEITEKEGNKVRIDNPDIIRKLEHVFNTKVQPDFVKLIKEMQEKDSDIFGFGEQIRANHPAYWNKHVKTKEDWHNIYKDVKVEVKVDSTIRKKGMEAK